MRAIKRGLSKPFSASSTNRDPSLAELFPPSPPLLPAVAGSDAPPPPPPEASLLNLMDEAPSLSLGGEGVRLTEASSPQMLRPATPPPGLGSSVPPPSGLGSPLLTPLNPSSPVLPPSGLGLPSQPISSLESSPAAPPTVAYSWGLAPPSPRRFSPIPHSAGVGLPLETLREVQHTFSINPWMLALPELAPFQAFIHDLAAAQETGTSERMLRCVRAQARAELEAERMQSEDRRSNPDERHSASDDRSDGDEAGSPTRTPGAPRGAASASSSSAGTPSLLKFASEGETEGEAPTAQEVDARVYEKAALLLPRSSSVRNRPSSSYEDVSGAPTIHLVSVRVGSNLLSPGEKPPKVHVVMWAVDSRDRCVGGIISWPTKASTVAPVWNSARQLAVGVSDSGAHLRIELWASQTDTVLGQARVPLHTLPERDIDVRLLKPNDVNSPRAGERESLVRLRCLRHSSSMKTVFFIRHGESKWNEAQAKRDVLEMVSQVDHPLNDKGYRQACELREAICAARDGAGGLSSSPSEAATLRALLGAQAVWASPLTRAIQTALVGLQPLLQKKAGAPGREVLEVGAPHRLERLGSTESTMSALSEASRMWIAAASGTTTDGGSAAHEQGIDLELKPNAREKKNMGGRDTQGLVVGADCARRAIAKLAEVAPADDMRSLAHGIRMNFEEVNEQWWDTAPESKDEVQERMKELLYQIQYSQHDTIVVVGHSHFFRAMFQRFLHSDIANRSAELATRLCKDVLPNCSVACCQLDFARGPRMITDVRLLITSPSPSGGMKLVMQRQFEQFAGPVVHLVGVNNVPLSEPAATRVCVDMWLADSSGVHIGRQAVWPATLPSPASEADARILSEMRSKRGRRALTAAWRGQCTWNSAHQLGQSHWGADSILHIAVRSAKTSAMLASAEVPMRCVPPEDLELGALNVAQPKAPSGKATQDGMLCADDPLRPCTITLRCVPPERSAPVKHLFLLHTAESSWSEAYRTMLRAAGISDPKGPLADKVALGDTSIGQAPSKLKERLGRIVDRGQEAYQRMRAVMARADHPISRNGFAQARRLGGAIRAAVTIADSRGGAAEAVGNLDAQLEAILFVLSGTHAVWSSPATRAVQTSQVAMLALLEPGGTIELKANARQRRGLTNPNTSIGSAWGDAIHVRCVEKLRELAAANEGLVDDDTLAQVEARKLDTLEASSAWWSEKAEADRDFQARVAELLAQIRHSHHESIVLCAHDDIFHEFLGRYTHPSARFRHAALLDQLAAGSVPPCALIWCCLDFGRESTQPITDIRNIGDFLPQFATGSDRSFPTLEPGLERVGTSPR